jgi:hypothetical protein
MKEVRLPGAIEDPAVDDFIFVDTILGLTPRGRVLVTTGPLQSKPGVVYFFDFDVDSKPEALHRYKITLPNGARADEIALSPRGDQLAWKLYFLHERPDANGKGGRAADELWISRADGSRMHPLASQDVRPRDYEVSEDSLVQLQWRPDGRQLSFVYEGVLYTIPAN